MKKYLAKICVCLKARFLVKFWSHSGWLPEKENPQSKKSFFFRKKLFFRTQRAPRQSPITCPPSPHTGVRSNYRKGVGGAQLAATKMPVAFHIFDFWKKIFFSTADFLFWGHPEGIQNFAKNLVCQKTPIFARYFFIFIQNYALGQNRGSEKSIFDP